MSERRSQPDDPTAEIIRWPEQFVETDRVGILASGSGTTFEAIGRAWREGRIKAGSLTLFVTTPEAGAIARAEKLEIPAVTVDLRDVKDFTERGDRLKEALDREGIQFVHCAGMTLIITGAVLEMPMTNTHPMILPDDPEARTYGGYDMIGMRVHDRVADDYYRGATARAGSTIHVVDPEPDHGPVIRVSSYDITDRALREGVDSVSAETLASWTQADERRNNIEVLETVCREGRLRRLDDVVTT